MTAKGNAYRTQVGGQGSVGGWLGGPPGAEAGEPARRDLGISKDPLRLALFGVVLISISRIHQHFSLVGQFRPALLLFCFCAAYVVLVPRSIDLDNLKVGPAPKAIAGLGILACLSAVFGISLGNSASFILAEYSRTLIFAGLLIVAIRSVRDLSTFIWGFVVSAGIWTWLSFFFFESRVDIGSGRENLRLRGLYTYDANDIGLIMMMTLPLALLVLQASRGKVAKGASMAILIGIVMTTAVTGSRGAMVGLFAVGAALFFTLTHIALVKRAGLIAVIGIALAIAAPAGYWESMRTLATPTDDYNWSSPDGRKEVALRGLEYMAAYPVFGIGIDNFGMAEGTISSKARTHVAGTGLRWTAAHNSYVQVGAELGPLGLALFIWILFAGTVGVRRMWHRIPAWWEHGEPERRFLFFACRYLPVAFVGFAVPALFVSFAYLTPFYFLAAFMTGFFLLVNQKLEEDREGSGSAPVLTGVRPGWRSLLRSGGEMGAGRMPRGVRPPLSNRRAGRPTRGGWRSGNGRAGPWGGTEARDGDGGLPLPLWIRPAPPDQARPGSEPGRGAGHDVGEEHP